MRKQSEMLPVVIYDRKYVCRRRMLDFLNAYTRDTGNRFTVLENTESISEALSCIEGETGVMLVMAGVRADGEAESVKLEHAAIGQNRDNYVLYWLEDLAPLQELAALCRRPAGFVVPPPQQEQFNKVMDRVFKDYSSIAADEDGEFISLQNAGTVFRLPIGRIDYVEAIEKKLNIWVQRQCFTVYETLGRMEAAMGERFFRCHRSFLVNYSHILRVDYAGMEVELNGGVRLPLSRSAKDRLKARVEKEAMHREG